MNAVSQKALQLYDEVTYDASVEFANNHALVSMLFRALIDSLNDALRHMRSNEYASKGQCITKAQGIIAGLISTLDFERGGDIAKDLASIYGYCHRSLTRAHAQNDESKLTEVRDTLNKLYGAWASIPPSIAKGRH